MYQIAYFYITEADRIAYKFTETYNMDMLEMIAKVKLSLGLFLYESGLLESAIEAMESALFKFYALLKQIDSLRKNNQSKLNDLEFKYQR